MAIKVNLGHLEPELVLLSPILSGNTAMPSEGQLSSPAFGGTDGRAAQGALRLVIEAVCAHR